MTEHSAVCKKHNRLSVMFIFLFLIASILYPIVGRWGSFTAWNIQLIALIIWIVWIAHLGWILSKNALVGAVYLAAKIFGFILASAIAIFVASVIGGFIGNALRIHEVRKSIDAGLREDCMNLLINWPIKDDRINEYTGEFAKLPSSIVALAPVYVSNEHLSETNIPPNIGLCKNGWGSFALGIRVFQNDADAGKLKCGGCQRVAPSVYIWWQ